MYIELMEGEGLATTPFNVFLLDINFDKPTIGLNFLPISSIYTYKISRRSKINKYVINQIFIFQIFVI